MVFVRVGENQLQTVAEASAKDKIGDKVTLPSHQRMCFSLTSRPGIEVIPIKENNIIV